MLEKLCKRCDKIKPLAEFATDRRRPDGKENRCKDCKRLGKQKSRSLRANAERRRIFEDRQDRITKVPIIDERETDGLKIVDKIKEKHFDTHFSISFHPHLDGYVVQMQAPRIYKEGKNLKQMLLELLEYKPIKRDRAAEFAIETERGW